MENRWKFYNPVQTCFGDDGLQEITSHIANLSKNSFARVAVITGQLAMKKNGFIKDVADSLGEIPFLIFDKINPEPTHECIMAGKKFVEDNEINFIIGFGGGSALDAAKAISCISYTDIDITRIMDREISIPERKIPLIAIPTTAGTGSEVTPYSVLTNEKTKAKKSIASSHYYPDVAILIPRFVTTVPQKTIADVGIDSLAHAFEALWSIHSQPISRGLSFQAIKLIKENLLNYFENPKDMTAASNMMMASNIAGYSFSNTFTAACHGLSFPIGERFKLSHGHSCAMTLHLIAEINKDVMKDTFTQLGVYLGIGGDSIPTFIRELRDSVYETKYFGQLGATKSDFEYIAKSAFRPLLNNNPIQLDEKAIIEVLNKAM